MKPLVKKSISCLLALAMLAAMVPALSPPLTAYAEEVTSTILITKQPADGVFAQSAPLRLYVQADSNTGGFLSYQWYQGEDPTDATLITGQTSATLSATTPATAGTYYYYCQVSMAGAASVDTRVAAVKVVDRTLETQLMNGDYQEIYGNFSDYEYEDPRHKFVITDVPDLGVKYWNTTDWDDHNTVYKQGKIMQIINLDETDPNNELPFKMSAGGNGSPSIVS
jgi:hypothetical protein